MYGGCEERAELYYLSYHGRLLQSLPQTDLPCRFLTLHATTADIASIHLLRLLYECVVCVVEYIEGRLMVSG